MQFFSCSVYITAASQLSLAVGNYLEKVDVDHFLHCRTFQWTAGFK
jgi:hypothetical protein